MMQQIQEHAGQVGAGVTIGTGAAGFAAKAIPWLQMISLSVSIIVGVLTAGWWVIRYYEKWKARGRG